MLKPTIWGASIPMHPAESTLKIVLMGLEFFFFPFSPAAKIHPVH